MFTTSLLSYCLGEGLRGRRVDRLETGPNSPPAWTGCLPLRRPESGREPVARSPHQRAMLLVTLAQTGKRGRQNNNGEGLETAEGEKRRERERENESSIAQVPWNAMEQQRGSRSDLSHDTNNNGFPFLSFLSDSLFGGAIAPRTLNFVAEPSREFCCRLRLLYLLD